MRSISQTCGHSRCDCPRNIEKQQQGGYQMNTGVIITIVFCVMIVVLTIKTIKAISIEEPKTGFGEDKDK